MAVPKSDHAPKSGVCVTLRGTPYTGRASPSPRPPRNAPAPALVVANPEPRRAYDPNKDRRGRPDGCRDMYISTHRETKAWRAMAQQHEAARQRLNALLPDWKEMRRGNLNDPAVQVALTAYRAACAAFIDYRDAKPRHLSTIFRCLCELLELGDPVWNDRITINEAVACEQARALLITSRFFRLMQRSLCELGVEW